MIANSTPSGHDIAACRVIVVGATGAGKTTFGRALAQKLGVPHVELDALHWGPDWAMPETDVFRARLEPVVAQPSWVMDGNYSRIRDLLWTHADTLVWLDYPLAVILWRLFWRTARRTLTRQELWNGNRESVREAFFSRESLFLCALKAHSRYRATYPRELTRPAYAHLRVVRLHTPRQAAAWLASIGVKIHSSGCHTCHSIAARSPGCKLLRTYVAARGAD